MTVQPTRDQLRAHLRRLIAAWEGPGNPSVSVADLAHLLDQLDAAERRADEAEARIAEEKRLRMKAVAAATVAEAEIERLENRAASETARADAWREKHRIMAKKRDAAHRARQAEREARRKAEARIQAVEDVLAAWHVEPGESGLADDLLRALNT